MTSMETSANRLLSLVEALLVTFLWSTSYVFIKIGLEEINPLTFAAYRYAIASVVLIVYASLCCREKMKEINLNRVAVFLALGFSGYFIAQGMQFLGLFYLSPVTVTFVLNLTPIFVWALSAVFLKEKPLSLQLLGMVLALIGILVYFHNSICDLGESTGILVTLVSGVGWSVYMILVRRRLWKENENVTVLTAYSMCLGALMLLGATALSGNVVNVSLGSWLIIIWLSIVNTAVAFVLWNHALKILKAYEQSILQNSMLIQITLLSVVFLGEQLTLQKIFGMALVFTGVLIVQLKARTLK
ncbi:EamA family transporter [Candidatus Bathyarchaeota archaeon]|nr:EamA family transporter [Candidatus Bathyarchaeota archaeon]